MTSAGIHRSGSRPSAGPCRIGRLDSGFTIALVAVFAAACTPAQNGGTDTADAPPAHAVSGDSYISLQRQPCFGTCPVYTVNLAADGTITFEGEQFVATMGTATRTITAREVAALMHSMEGDGFFELDDRYTYGDKGCGQYHTDAPRVILTLRMDGRTKTVEHDYGCNDAPAPLRVMQERVDSVAGVSRWIGPR